MPQIFINLLQLLRRSPDLVPSDNTHVLRWISRRARISHAVHSSSNSAILIARPNRNKRDERVAESSSTLVNFLLSKQFSLEHTMIFSLKTSSLIGGCSYMQFSREAGGRVESEIFRDSFLSRSHSCSVQTRPLPACPAPRTGFEKFEQ